MKRTVEIKVRLSTKEFEKLDNRVKRSRLSREAYLRQLIDGYLPTDAPPPDYYAMMKELYRIGNNLNQIAAKAHVLNVIDVQRYDGAVKEFEDVVIRMMTTNFMKGGMKPSLPKSNGIG